LKTQRTKTRSEIKTTKTIKQPERAIQKKPFPSFNLKLWFEVLVKPTETITRERSNPNWRNALLNTALSGLASGFIIGAALLTLILFQPSALESEASLLPSNPLAAILSTLALLPLIWTALILASSFINTLIFWAFSKLFNGKGAYLTQYYLTSIYSAPVNIIASIITLAPLAFSLALLLILILYALYALFITLKTTHEYSNLNTALSITTPLIILLITLSLLAIL